MNIFILDKDIKKSVSYLVEKHLTKMPLETVQILCSPYDKGVAPYKKTHVNHPCCRWARESKENYEWLLEYGENIFKEFENRRNKPHASKRVLTWCKENYHLLNLPSKELTPFPQAIPDKYKNKNVVSAYRTFYMNDKRHIAIWANKIPEWWS